MRPRRAAFKTGLYGRLRGVRVVKPRQLEYEWSYAYGALEVVDGDSGFQLLPTVGLPLTAGFLVQIAASDPEAFQSKRFARKLYTEGLA